MDYIKNFLEDSDYTIDNLVESLESEKELRVLNRKLVEHLIKTNVNDLASLLPESYDKYLDLSKKRSYYLLKVFPDWLKLSKSKLLKPFLQNFQDRYFGIYLIVGNFPQKKGIAGVYNSKSDNISLFLDSQEMEDRIMNNVYEAIEERSNKKLEKILAEVFTIGRNPMESTLLHELTHAYDDYQSKGKYNNSNYITPEKGYKDYAKQNIEVNARFAQAIDILEKQDMKYVIGDFDDFMTNAKSAFEGWKILSIDQQKRLTNRFYDYYTEPLKDMRRFKSVRKKLYTRYAYNILNNIDRDNTNPNLEIPIPESLKGMIKSTSDFKDFLKEIAQDLIDGNYDNKVFKNPRILENPYSAFSMIHHKYKMLSGFRRAIKDSDLMNKLINETLLDIEALGQVLDLTELELKTISSRFDKK
jgi:hypothetical protein